ncbi:MAG: glutathione S-transferase [Hyphomicrobiaceae bacterium]|nr:glutathione S-transferase [Hyphomicrobiaceae bacterium]
MKIIEQAKAPNPRRVRIFLAEKGITVPSEEIDILKREHRSTAFTAQNPLQQVPVLVLDDGTAISESVAICRYFEEQQPEPALFGKGAMGRVNVEMWQRRMEFGLLYRVAQCFRHSHPAMAGIEEPQVKEWGDANRPRVIEVLSWLDTELAGCRYIAGGEYTIADITALVAVDFMKPARIERPGGLENLQRWYEDVASRPSAKA